MRHDPEADCYFKANIKVALDRFNYTTKFAKTKEKKQVLTHQHLQKR